MLELPDGATWRRATTVDADAIFDLVAERNTSVVGFPDVTRDDIADELVEPGFDLATDGWLVEGADGALLGWGWAFGRGTSDSVDIDVYWRDRAVGRWLFARTLERAREMARRAGHAQAQVDVGSYRTDEAQRALVAEFGFEPSTSFHRMRIDHDGPRTEPTTPEGVEVEIGPGDEALRRAAHAVHQASFADHHGFVPQDFDHWLRALEASSTHDWGQLQVVWVAGAGDTAGRQAAGVLIGNDQFVEDEDCGYVRIVGVLDRYRGRGLARLLLERAFARDAAAGRAGTLLHVDTGNVTPALDLYLSVGMRAVLVIDIWRVQLPAF
jgi:GNAT superfamily N-acetyltransferase